MQSTASWAWDSFWVTFPDHLVSGDDAASFLRNDELEELQGLFAGEPNKAYFELYVDKKVISTLDNWELVKAFPEQGTKCSFLQK